MSAPELQAMLEDLIALPSVSCTEARFDSSNAAVVSRLAEWLEAEGFAVRVQDIPGHPGKQNVLGALGRGPAGLVLAGHTDTVPCDPGEWHSDPFRLTERDGRLHGLGVADMKSFFAFVLAAARRIPRHALRKTLLVLGTADEESSMCGARALDGLLPAAEAALIGEPTGGRPVRLHKGTMMESVRLLGKAGHSSDPALGNNALEGMHRVIGALLAFREELARRYRNPAFQVPVPTLNLGHIHGGDNPNRICPQCELHFDLRLLPGMRVEAVRAELHERVRDAVAGTGLGVEFTALFEGVEALDTPPRAAVIRACEELTGHPAGVVGFTTEGPLFRKRGIETVIMGPGDIAQAHQPDEWLAIASIKPYVDFLERLIRRFCT